MAFTLRKASVTPKGDFICKDSQFATKRELKAEIARSSYSDIRWIPGTRIMAMRLKSR